MDVLAYLQPIVYQIGNLSLSAASSSLYIIAAVFLSHRIFFGLTALFLFELHVSHAAAPNGGDFLHENRRLPPAHGISYRPSFSLTRISFGLNPSVFESG